MLENPIRATEEKITASGLKNSNAKVIPAGTVLVSIFATVGRATVLGIDAATNQAIVAVMPKAGVELDRGFLLHALTASTASLVKEARGVAQVNINSSILKQLRIPLPPLPEQRRIADILDRADALKRKRQQALQLADDFLRATFLDMFGDPLRPDGTFAMPRLGEVASTTSGGTPSRKDDRNYGGDVPWVKSGELHTDIVIETEEFLSVQGLSNSAAKIMPPGTILLAMYGATAGVVSELGLEAATNQAICSITVGPSVDRLYIKYFLKAVTANLLKQCVGGAQPNLNQELIRDMRIPVPPLELQKQFALAVENVSVLKRRLVDSAMEALSLAGSLQLQLLCDTGHFGINHEPMHGLPSG